MPDRYFSETPIGDNAYVGLGKTESHHLLHVMRAKVGDRVELFDGSGMQFDAVVERLARSSVTVEIVGREEVDRELPVDVTIGVAMPKGDRQRWLIEKLTELGCHAVVPVATQRGAVKLNEKMLDKLRRYVIDASKQCGRNRLMRIESPMSFCQWLATYGASKNEDPVLTARFVAHPYAVGDCDPQPIGALAQSVRSGAESVSVVIGPEGGLTNAEVEQAGASGFTPIELGQRILRIETAAAMLMSVIAAS